MTSGKCVKVRVLTRLSCRSPRRVLIRLLKKGGSKTEYEIAGTPFLQIFHAFCFKIVSPFESIQVDNMFKDVYKVLLLYRNNRYEIVFQFILRATWSTRHFEYINTIMMSQENPCDVTSIPLCLDTVDKKSLRIFLNILQAL